MVRLGAEELAVALRRLPAWSVDGGRLYRGLSFPNFAAAFTFMEHVATRAEALDHHPDWCNSGPRVRIWLTTHDAGGLTALDIELAAAIDQVAP